MFVGHSFGSYIANLLGALLLLLVFCLRAHSRSSCFSTDHHLPNLLLLPYPYPHPHALPVPSLSPHASIYIFPFLARPTLKGRVTLAVADRAYRRTPFIGAALHGLVTKLFDSVLHALSSPAKREQLKPTDPRLLRAIFRVAAMEREEIGGKPDLSHVDIHGTVGSALVVRGLGTGGGGGLELRCPIPEQPTPPPANPTQPNPTRT